MAEQCIYSKAQLPVSPMTFDTRDFHFKCAICYLKTKQGGLSIITEFDSLSQFKINEGKNAQTKLSVNETVEQCLRAASCQICPHHYQCLQISKGFEQREPGEID